MGLLDALGYRLLCKLRPPQPANITTHRSNYVEQIRGAIGDDGWEGLQGKTKRLQKKKTEESPS